MRTTRFIFIEGIMGAGKTTAVYSLVIHLRREGIAARALWEGPTHDEPDHPLRIGPTLAHPYAPWEDLSVDGYIEESLRRWRRYIAWATTSDAITVSDGLLFHGNMTDLMLMDAAPERLRQYAADIIDVLAPLTPAVIYLRRADIARALSAVIEVRGKQWQEYQVNWKLRSPLAMRRGWQGFAGLVDFYTEYRAVCDAIFETLDVPKVLLTHDTDWEGTYRRIADFLDLLSRGSFVAAHL